ncbi:actin-like ATPase domain-containing protein [Dendrothele bispora CBS 962.96]|uniref:Actin-like ATPase domain-containing protein n=1 Tax=Dendrothele bispora (strain CBS 962.96) TaxID=1314807 RepID=A0A4S8KYN6_DENBC|nr:actin-like ATPase domain-containing protein [Dendrothele bispora CBS 962.96]
MQNAMIQVSKYTAFHVPLAINPKHLGSTYLKSENQTIWSRNAQRKSKAPPEEPAAPEQRRGSQVIVVHPGSRFTRIGRASDVTPLSVPTVIARKTKPPVTTPTFVEGISRPRKGRRNPRPAEQKQGRDEYEVVVSSDDPFEEKIAAITMSLRDRMRFYKLRVSRNAGSIASTYNDSRKPEIIAEHNDPYRIDWIDGPNANEDVLVGEQALRIADPQASNYMVRWPIYGSNFNTRDYPSIQLILSDIEVLLRATLQDQLGIEPSDYQKYSVVLIIPDFWNRSYVRELVHMLLVSMGFKQLCTQQESLAATYGAGISNACVVDIGAKNTSVACVDEGLVIADTRIALGVGGDDITEFLYVLLDRICFPYRDINLARSYDWNVMEDLKTRMCTLLEVDVALNLYDFIVRKPAQPAEKYSIRVYDEIILAPMSIFEPRVIEFDRKRVGTNDMLHSDVTEEILDQHPSDQVVRVIVYESCSLI